MSSRWMFSVAVSTALLVPSCSNDDGSDGNNVAAGSAGGSAMASASGSGGMASGGSAGTGMGAASMNAGGMNASGMNEPTELSFETDVWPVLRASCDGAGCHGAGSFLPEHANPDVEVAFDEAAPVADRIAGRVSGQLTPIMPQGCGPAPGFGMCLSLEEVALIRAWVEQGAPF
jgi:hypothetical protein